jgi:hypothetical protein
MIIQKTDIATICKSNEKSIDIFFADFSKKITNFKNDNIIIDISDNKGEKTENILLFLQYSKLHRNNGMSFVIVYDGIHFDDLPDEIIVVPSLDEAKDLIEMENIERDLGL